MDWFVWVIIALVAIIALLLVGLYFTARAAGWFANAAVKTWVKGNFGKND